MDDAVEDKSDEDTEKDGKADVVGEAMEDEEGRVDGGAVVHAKRTILEAKESEGNMETAQ